MNSTVFIKIGIKYRLIMSAVIAARRRLVSRSLRLGHRAGSIKLSWTSVQRAVETSAIHSARRILVS